MQFANRISAFLRRVGHLLGLSTPPRLDMHLPQVRPSKHSRVSKPGRAGDKLARKAREGKL